MGDDLSDSRVGEYTTQIRIAEAEKVGACWWCGNHLPSATPHPLCVSQENRIKAVSDALADVVDLWDELGEVPNPDDEFEVAVANNGEGLGFSLATIEKVSALANALSAKKAAYERQIKALGVQITALWDRLKVSEADRDEWLALHTGVGEAVVQAVRRAPGCAVFHTE